MHTATFSQIAHGLQDVASCIPEFHVVDDAVGKVFTAHVCVGATNEEAQSGVIVEFIGRRGRIVVDRLTVDVQH